MVAPTAFTFNVEAAQDNHFMHAESAGGDIGASVRSEILKEFAGLYKAGARTACPMRVLSWRTARVRHDADSWSQYIAAPAAAAAAAA